jgi:hypothetical protein
LSRPDNRNYLAVEANPETGITTSEKFVTHFYASSGVVARPIAVGVCYEWSVPAGAATHYAWIAAGAYYHQTDDYVNQWLIQGQLNFFRGGRAIGEFYFGDHSGLIDVATGKKAGRTLLRFRPDGGGSYQPILRYQEDGIDPLVARTYLDLSCFSIPVRCDKIQYEIKSFYIDPFPTRTGAINFLTGARIVSLP